MRKDHFQAPAPAQHFATVDDKLEELSKDARRMAYEQDCLKLTRDVAQLGCLYQEEVKSERSDKMKKVLHLKHQNRLGASSINHFMDLNLRFVAGRMGELEAAADKAGSDQTDPQEIETGVKLLMCVVMTHDGLVSKSQVRFIL